MQGGERSKAKPVLLALTIAILAGASSAAGQTPAPPRDPILESSFDAEIARDLPTSNNPFALPETVQPEVIGNLFSAGGLNVAAAPQFGAFLSSWTQTQIRIGDISIADPRTGGTPLLLPIVPLWDRLTVATGAMGVEESASALSMRLDPLRPGATWRRTIEGSGAAPPFVAEASNPDAIGPVPAVDRVRQWRDASVVVDGPLTSRLGILAGFSWRSLAHVAAPSASEVSDRVASGLAHLVFAPNQHDEVRALGWLQRVTTDAFTDTAVHLQSTWERRDPNRTSWRVFGGYTERSRTTPTTSVLLVDSITSDPVSDLFDAGAGTTRRWTAGARLAPAPSRLLPSIGFDVEGAELRLSPTGLTEIRERVNGVPARIWSLRPGTSGADVRQLTTFAAYANEHVTYGRLTVDAGLRLDTINGSANGAAQDIRWTTWLPRAMLRWHVTNIAGLDVVAAYRRSAYQLPLNVLAIGDPAAPVADVAVWNGTTSGPLVARVGPGTGGDPAFSRIDPNLQRPTTDELVLAIESRPLPGVHVVLARVTKREEPLFGLVDTGVTSSSYSAFQVPDVSFIPGSDDGAPFVTVYNRPAASYGSDRYLLTNQTGEPAKFWGIDLSVRATTKQFTILAGGTLTWALGPAAAVGFLPTENDQNVLGNLLIDRNTATDARGQLFPDRSHVVKIAGIYRFPSDVTLGVIARYQDGQPFARLIVVPNLTQGTTAVRGYPNGGTAFTYIGTLDVRLQKSFAAGGTRVAAIVDVYNLPNLGNEVAENVVSGPLFRAPTALQPPRTVVASLRVTF